jgi:hypothetical protein
MTGFGKRRSGGLVHSSTLTSISSVAETNVSDESWHDAVGEKTLPSPPALGAHVEPESSPSPSTALEALNRSMTCTELLSLRMAQLEEKARFLEFQASLLSRLSSQQIDRKAEMRIEHERLSSEQQIKVTTS